MVFFRNIERISVLVENEMATFPPCSMVPFASTELHQYQEVCAHGKESLGKGGGLTMRQKQLKQLSVRPELLTPGNEPRHLPRRLADLAAWFDVAASRSRVHGAKERIFREIHLFKYLSSFCSPPKGECRLH